MPSWLWLGYILSVKSCNTRPRWPQLVSSQTIWSHYGSHVIYSCRWTSLNVGIHSFLSVLPNQNCFFQCRFSCFKGSKDIGHSAYIQFRYEDESYNMCYRKLQCITAIPYLPLEFYFQRLKGYTPAGDIWEKKAGMLDEQTWKDAMWEIKQRV